MAKRSQNKQQRNFSSNKKNYSKSAGNSKNDNQKAETSSDSSNVNGKSPETPPPSEPTNGNDPEWYSRDPAILRDAASIYFSYAFGKTYYLNGSAKHMPNSNQYVGRIEVPGILVQRLKPSMGFSDSTTSPLNVSAASIYAYVRHMNSGRKNYDPSDLMIYLTSIASIYSAIVWAQRLYSFATAFSNSNRYIGNSLLRAEGVDPDDMRLNLANYRMKLNEYINKVSVFAVPKDITYFNKLAFMYRDIFIENGDANIRDQLYYYVPDGFYKFALDSDKLGMLDYVHWDHGSTLTTLAKWTDVIALLEDLISGLFEDEDASLMSGDLFKVYGDNIIRLTSMPEDLPLPLVYDPMILWQMKNSNVCDVIRASNIESVAYGPVRTNYHKTGFTLGNGRNQIGRPGCVFQTNDGILYSVERIIDTNTSANGHYTPAVLNTYGLAINKLLSTDLPNPTTGVVMESSRMVVGPHDAPFGYSGTESNPDVGWVECGSFIVVEEYVGVYIPKNSNSFAFFRKFHTLIEEGLVNNVPTTMSWPVYFGLSFKYSSLMFAYRLDGNGDLEDYYPITDINNYAVLDSMSVTKLHEAALLSLFYVPGIARIG